MPLYTYTCRKCDDTKEHIVRYDKRDLLLRCPCGGRMQRWGVEPFALGQPAFQMQGILADGTHVPGQFGKDAKRIRRKKP